MNIMLAISHMLVVSAMVSLCSLILVLTILDRKILKRILCSIIHKRYIRFNWYSRYHPITRKRTLTMIKYCDKCKIILERT